MSFDGDPLAYYGKRLIEEYHASLLKDLKVPFEVKGDEPDPFENFDEVLHFLPRLKVGILGAGVGGLYTAMILDSLGIKCEILEASDRTGGRISTFKFEKGGKYDYYERGAMRFPLPKKTNGVYKNGVMKRLADLIDCKELNPGSDDLRDKLIPYYYHARDSSHPGFYYFNRILEPVSKQPKGGFDARGMNVDGVYAQAGSKAIVDDVINPFVKKLVEDIRTNGSKGWEKMMENDKYSTRAYMASEYRPNDSLKLPPKSLPTNVINWCELLEDSTGGFSHALTETVLDALAFAQVGDTNYGDVDWKCFEGGTQTLSNKMEEYIESRRISIRTRKRVTAISKGFMIVLLPRGFPRDRIPHHLEVKSAESMQADIEVDMEDFPGIPLDNCLTTRWMVKIPCTNVTVNGNETRKYSHVISTLPLPALRTVDLNNAGLSVMQRNALRALDYGPAVKIAIRFKSNWWTTKLGIVGGQSFTDLPIRTIVYPSYGVDSDTPCKVLIASYTWTADANRLGSLSTLIKKSELRELVLRNLAEAHGRLKSDITYEYLDKEFEEMDVHDWIMIRAYAHFAPGSFKDLYTSLNFPAANKRLHFAGEAISVRHAWIAGALDSAWRAVHEFLTVTGQDHRAEIKKEGDTEKCHYGEQRQANKVKQLEDMWGGNFEWISDPTLVSHDQAKKFGLDLLDEQLGLVDKAIAGGVIAESKLT